jgi:folate-binding protein YgfZ
MSKSFAAHAAAGDGVAIHREARLSLLRVGGKDRARFLHAVLTQDIRTLGEGSWAPAAFLTNKGALRAFLAVLNPGEEFWLAVDDLPAETVGAALSRHRVIEEAPISPLAPRMAVLRLLGRRSEEALGSALPAPGEFRPVRIGGEEIWAAGDDRPLAPTALLFVPETEVDRIEAALGAPELDPAAAEALRVEAGIPRFGLDVGEGSLPMEVRHYERGISFQKGCYVGQETVVRVAHRGGQVARRLMAVEFGEGADLVESGSPVVRGDDEVGRITSGAFSPLRGRFVGLALVKRSVCEDGIEVSVNEGENRLPATVRELPLKPR